MTELDAMFTVEYLQDEGEIQFTSTSLYDISVEEIYGLISDSNIDTDVTQIKGGLSISIPLFIEFFDSIIDVIRNVDDEVFLTDNARQITHAT